MSITDGNFVSQLSDLPEPDKYAIKVFYIPNKEFMEDDHIDCGLGKNKKNKKYHYIGAEDIYQAIFDHCESLEGINLFQSDYGNNYSYNVVGLGHEIKSPSLIYLNQQPRPLTQKEKITVAKEKLKIKQLECSTNLKTVEAAKMLLLIKSESLLFDLRLSEYFNPGCAGHLYRNFVLDFLQDNKVVKTYTISFYQGGY